MRQTKFAREAVGQTKTLIVVAIGAACLWAVTGAQTASPRALDAVAIDGPDRIAQSAVCDMEEGTATQAAIALRPCKPCKDRPWCECTLNGAPRISCDPCCYDTHPYPTCLD